MRSKQQRVNCLGFGLRLTGRHSNCSRGLVLRSVTTGKDIISSCSVMYHHSDVLTLLRANSLKLFLLPWHDAPAWTLDVPMFMLSVSTGTLGRPHITCQMRDAERSYFRSCHEYPGPRLCQRAGRVEVVKTEQQKVNQLEFDVGLPELCYQQQ